MALEALEELDEGARFAPRSNFCWLSLSGDEHDETLELAERFGDNSTALVAN